MAVLGEILQIQRAQAVAIDRLMARRNSGVQGSSPSIRKDLAWKLGIRARSVKRFLAGMRSERAHWGWLEAHKKWQNWEDMDNF
jgi:hypothetical protein